MTGDTLIGLEELKRRWMKQELERCADAALRGAVERAADEALALAWTTPFPALFLPCLLQEKAAEARRRWERQQSVMARSIALFYCFGHRAATRAALGVEF